MRSPESAARRASYAREYYAKNREAIRAKANAVPRTDEQRKADAARQRACYYRHNIEKWRGYNRKKRGLPEPTRDCPTVCEICGKAPRGGRALDLDHCHATGQFRGWLCNTCNSGIGSLGDDSESLMRALRYLLEFEGKNRA